MLSYAEFCDKFNIRLDAQQAQAVLDGRGDE